MNGWFTRLAREISPLLLQNGGPIIAIQVENEYGSFGNDHAYMQAVKSALLKSGLAAPATLLYTADGADQIPNGALPELPAVINFGSGDAQNSFSTLKKLRPDGPFMSGEYWAGWFDHWGEHHHTTDAASNAAEYEWMLRQGYSVSMYMFHGGTNFGFMNGANSNGTNYEPDTTSYDYDAPLNESGQPTAKFRDLPRRHRPCHWQERLPTFRPQRRPAPIEDRPARADRVALRKTSPRLSSRDKLLTMEDLGQAYGYLLYRTQLAAGPVGELVIDGLHDYAQVYIDPASLIGTLDRRHRSVAPSTAGRGGSCHPRHPRRELQSRQLHQSYSNRAQGNYRLRHNRWPTAAALADLFAST